MKYSTALPYTFADHKLLDFMFNQFKNTMLKGNKL